MSRFLVFTFLFVATSLSVAAQPAISYYVGWDDPTEHYFDIEMEVGDLDEATVDVRMPAWRPGRYIIQNYARYVIGFEAHAPNGDALPFEKIDRDTWRITTNGNDRVRISYKNYANVLDAGESYLDETEAYLNPISVLMNVRDRMEEPVSLTMKQPDGWQIATPLDPTSAANQFVAEDYHELVDSPFVVSPNLTFVEFEEGGATFEIAIQGDWDFNEERLIADHQAIAEAQFDIMEDVPFERYLFLYHVMDHPIGHGVEHKNSTSIVLGPASAMTMPGEGEYPEGLYQALLSVASHELFHVWNVERIRPEAMYPTDYSTEQYTSQMWIFEGITDYYAHLTLFQAGLTSEETLLADLAGTIRSFNNNPGRHVTSIAMSSFDSWTKQGEAPPNTFYSFYTAGKAMGIVLDMEVRGRTDGEKSLDDVFRYLYEEYPMNDRGVPEDGFLNALNTITDSSFDTFFDRHIFGTEDVDWNQYLAHGGLALTEETDDNPASWMRVFFGEMAILGLHPSGPAAAAGLEAGDEIVRVGSRDVSNSDELRDAFLGSSPGDVVELTFVREGEEQTTEIEVGAPRVQASLGMVNNPTPQQSEIYEDWLGR